MTATVYACGSGEFLGIEQNLENFTPVVFQGESNERPKMFKSVEMSPSFGYQAVLHTVSHTGEKEAYHVGYCYNDDKTTKVSKFSPLRAPLGATIIQSACGYFDVAYLTGNHSELITKNLDRNEVYARGEQFESSGDKTTFVKVSVESGVRVKELLPTFYGLYITCDKNNVYRIPREHNLKFELCLDKVTEFTTGGYKYAYKSKIDQIFNSVEKGEFFYQYLKSFDTSGAPCKITIPNEKVAQVKLGWYKVYVKTESNKLYQAGESGLRGSLVFTQIPLHPNVGTIRDFTVHIDELFVVGEDNRLYAYGVRSISHQHAFREDYPEMTELDITTHRNAIPGANVRVVGRYEGAYLLISKDRPNLDVFKSIKKMAFIDLEIVTKH